jgi:acyl dehydratase
MAQGTAIDIDIDGDGSERFATITDEAVELLRRAIGVPITDTVEPWCYEVTRDNIRHYAHGIGDDNPLWCNPEYARTGPHGTLVAPPSFVFALNRILSGYVGGLPGVHAMWAGADLHWLQPLRLGTEIKAKAHLKDLVEHQTRFAGRAYQQIYHVELSSAEGELLCEGDSWCFRTERDTARERGTKYEAVKASPRAPYSEEELREIYDGYENEEVSGSVPRYFEDVKVGDKLPNLVKGPMTVTGFIAFAQGWGGLYIRANKLAYQQIRKHPGLGIPNSMGIPDVPERVHWEEEFALAVGTPGAYDYGPERCSWLTHQLTNWIGDDGFLVRHSSQIRHHNIAGDWIKIEGTVTAVDADDREGPTVTVDQRAYNQDGNTSALGTGVVRLPRKPTL